MSNLFDLYAAQAATSKYFRGITDMNFRPNKELVKKTADGEESPRFIAMKSSTPGVDLTTLNVEEALDITGVDGAEVPAEQTAIFSFCKKSSYHGRATTGGEKYTFTKGLFVPRTLSGEAGEDSALQVEFFGISADGVTSPYTRSANVTAITPLGVSESFVFGKCTLAAAAIPQIARYRLDFGAAMGAVRYKIYPEEIVRDEWLPVLTLYTHDLSAEATITEPGAAGEVILFLQQRTKHAGLAAASASSHIKITMKVGYLTTQVRGGTQKDNKTLEIQIHGEWDGTNVVLVYEKDKAMET